MPELILPSCVMHNLELERSLERVEVLRQRGHALTALDQSLRDLDPMLGLVRASEQPENDNLRPGYWHVRRCNAPFPDTYLVIDGVDGEFVEPHSGILNVLREQDMRRQGWFDELRRRKDREDRERAQRRRDLSAERVDELAGRMKAYGNPGVAFGTRGWTYRAGARGG